MARSIKIFRPFEEQEKYKLDQMLNTTDLVPYNILIDLKLRSRRDKNLYDIAQLEKLRNNK